MDLNACVHRVTETAQAFCEVLALHFIAGVGDLESGLDLADALRHLLF